MPRHRGGDLRGRAVDRSGNAPITGIRDNHFYHPFLTEPVPYWVLFDFYGPPTEIKPPAGCADDHEATTNGPEREEIELEAAQPEDDDDLGDKLPSPLRVQEVDLCVADNAVTHHTNDYEITEEREEEVDNVKTILPPQLVVRRGHPFLLQITFDRPYDRRIDKLYLVFEIGKKPMESKKTKVTIKVSGDQRDRHWCAVLSDTNDKQVTIQVHTPSDCIIGKWNIRLDSRIKKKVLEEREEEPRMKISAYKFAQPVYILFNAWCKDDQVYVEEDLLREEYVMNENGLIYTGNYRNIRGRPWKFAQFEDFMIDCCLELLAKAGLTPEKCFSAVDICRAVAAIVNSQDEGGVLVGRWSQPYSDGRPPTAWVGSNLILEQYHKTQEPIKYGQCWVFSGVVTSVCRTLGIPCRSVTNFASAHDTDGSITIDYHYDSSGKLIDHLNLDSIWNFHVWNEAWMSRPDLPTGCGGWQAFDATPQETSDGIYMAGPASVNSIKNGNVALSYDGRFIFAEVNGDVINHIEKGMSHDTIINRNHVGRCISTKRPGMHMTADHREDITNQYKYNEGTELERAAVYRANMASTVPGKYYNFGNEDVKFDLDQSEGVLVGSGFDISVKMQNKSRQERNVHLTLTVESVFYTGVPVAKIKQKVIDVSLKPIKTDEVVVRIAPEEYIYHIEEDASFRVHIFAKVEETKQIHAKQEDYRLIKPTLDIKTKGEIKFRKPFSCTVTFLNPMPVTLTKCEWQVTGLTKPSTYCQSHSNVEPNDRVEATFELTPYKRGEREIIISFSSKELTDVTGEHWVTVN